jgi:phage minor structural protein
LIRLFEKEATTFTTNGITVLNNLIKATSKEVLNGLYSAEFEAIYDTKGKWKEIIEGRIIHVSGQPFRIYRTRKGMRSLYIYTRHVFWDLVYNEVRDIRPTNKGAQAALEDVLVAANYLHPFTAFSDISTPATQYFINRNIADCIIGADSIITRWNGELKLDGWLISILAQRGQDNGVTISYRKNMLDVEVTEDYDSIITRIRPKGKDGLELPEIYVDSPYIGVYNSPRIKEVEFDIGIDEETTEEEAITQLREAVTSYFIDTKCDLPVTNIKVDMLNLENTEEYRSFSNLVKVELADTVTCRHLDLGIDHKSRVISIEKDLLLGRTSKVEIGDFKERVSGNITKLSDAQKTIAQTVERNNSDLSAAILNATSLLTSALGGYVLKRNGEILIMDTDDPATAQKIWRWNINGLGYSSSGINGNFPIAITNDGRINASFVTTGELGANIVKSGILQSANGSSWINLADGTFSLGAGKLTNNDISYAGTSIEQALNGKADISTVEDINQYFNFDDIIGLTIGDSNSNLKINITNQQMNFKDGQAIVAYINGQIMYIKSAQVLESMVVGNHKIEKYDANITLVRWIG